MIIDFSDPAFLQDPYPVLNTVREKTALFRQSSSDGSEQWFLTRHEDVFRALRDRLLDRVPEPIMTAAAVGLPPPREDWAPYYDIEQRSPLMYQVCMPPPRVRGEPAERR